MEAIEILKALGQETLYIETIYLNLKIEKELQAENFGRDMLLNQAERLWRDIDNEYFKLLTYLQNSHGQAA